jgi:hypothetical protein
MNCPARLHHDGEGSREGFKKRGSPKEFWIDNPDADNRGGEVDRWLTV